ncbi:MAG: hypothetical protein NC310_08830 [Roseburia sp.]|nr:hypothetical protein [Roseburia sp.]
MSTNSNFKKNECWSCEFYHGHRQFKSGILGDSVETDDKGICSNNRSSNNGKQVFKNNYCSKYQKWGILLSALARKETHNDQNNLEKKTKQKSLKVQSKEEKATLIRQIIKRLSIIFGSTFLLVTILFFTLPFLVETIIRNNEISEQEPEIDLSEYDYVVGKDYSDLVKITFIIANIEGRIGETWKVWGVPRNQRLNSYEPIYPEKHFDYAQYGLTPDFSYLKGENIYIDSYLFDKDTTVYCKYYGGNIVASPSLTINIVKEKSHIISGEAVSVSMRINTEVYELPSLENKFSFLTDLGEYRTKSYEYSAFYNLIKYPGYTKFTWFYDEDLTQKISLPYRIPKTDKIVYWVLAEK